MAFWINICGCQPYTDRNNLVELAIQVTSGMHQGEGQGGQLPPQILADQLTLSQPGGADYAHHSTTCPPGFLTLGASLKHIDSVRHEGKKQ